MNGPLLRKLTASGVLTDDWSTSFRAIPRREFLPDTLWSVGEDGNFHPVHKAEHPETWREMAESEDPVVTQIDDGRPLDGVGYRTSSSSSMPHIVALMLKHLEVSGGERVLEIGTGTGWNAALLAQRLGADRVTTIEIDQELAEQARNALFDAGFGGVTVITGNGSEGYPKESPYHRILSTAACHTVPFAWVEQCRPGGRIVTPWGSELYNWGLLSLDVHGDGTATGGIVDTAAFMRLRDQRIPFCAVDPSVEEEAAAMVRDTWLRPTDVVKQGGGLLLAVSVRVSDCQARYRPPVEDPDGEAALYLADRHSGSWARLYAHPDSHGPYKVTQGGPRQLFDEVEAAVDWWSRQGRPGIEDWRFLVGKDGQRIELM